MCAKQKTARAEARSRSIICQRREAASTGKKTGEAEHNKAQTNRIPNSTQRVRPTECQTERNPTPSNTANKCDGAPRFEAHRSAFR